VGTPLVQAAKKATSTIPIVMAAATDPVETGLIASLARPGGNVTGVNSGGAEIPGKRLELLRELVPRATRVAVLWNPDNLANEIVVADTKAAAQALEELLVSSLAQTDPLANLLIEKGLITREEFM
jgi:putative tryptophan/tyrosine transport system substrate-binding protein